MRESENTFKNQYNTNAKHAFPFSLNPIKFVFMHNSLFNAFDKAE